jgi:membrane protease YdiL (CAAX protease family)
MTQGEEVLLTTLIWLGLGVVGALVCGAIWWRFRTPRGRLLPPRRRWRPVPWGGLEVVCLFLAVYSWPALLERLFERQLGPPTADDRAVRAALALALAVPVQVLTIMLVLRVRRVWAYEVGIHTSRLPANVVLGYLGWLVLLPAIYAVDVLTELGYALWNGQPPDPHPLLRIIESQGGALPWLLFWFLAVVGAPVVEELMFRGLLQGWLLSRRWGGHVGMLLTVVLSRGPSEDEGWERTIFAAALLPGYLLLGVILARRGVPPAAEPDAAPPTADEPFPVHAEGVPPAGRAGLLAETLHRLRRAEDDPRVRDAWAIYATAALFAVVHQWPTPVPLFPLGLGLGWLAYRTRSLVGPMVLHALFNSVACLTAAWEQCLRD